MDMASDPDLSIIIVNWKVRDLLKLCLQSVLDQAQMPPHRFEIFVVDNDSGDDSVEMVRQLFPRVKVIANSRNVGFGAANNQAFRLCRGKYLLLLNPDTVILDHAIDRMIAHMEALPAVAALGCRLLNGDGTLQRWTGGAFPDIWNAACHYLFLGRILPKPLRPAPLYLPGDVTRDIDVDWLCGAFILLRRSCLGTSLFNEEFFMYGEDMELCFRLKKAGYRVVYSPLASIIHYQGQSMKQQQGDILLSSLKGPRQFFRMTQKNSPAIVLDLLAVCGFFLRWLLYRFASMGSGKEKYSGKARSSWRYMGIAWRVMRTAK